MKKIVKLFNWKLTDLLMVLVGSIMFCFAINVFIVPNNLYTGGVLGIAQLIRSFIKDILHIHLGFDISGIIYYLINIPLFVVAYKNVSKSFFVRTLFAVTIQTILLSVIPTKPIVDDLFINILIGGLLAGAGIGITLSCGSSSGGTDIVGVAIAKKNNNVSVGKIGLVVNVIIYTITGLMYGIETMVYSIVYAVAENLMIDKMHEQNICSTAFIFCKKNPRVVNDFIKNDLGRDFTYWDAKGGYDDTRTYIIYTALTKYELNRLERFLKDMKDNSFMIKSEGVGIKGEFEKKF